MGALRRQIAALLAATSETAILDARILVAHAAGRRSHDIALIDDRPLPAAAVALALALAERRRQGEPVGRIVGEREFWGLPLRLTAATLEPRPDTETVVSAALATLGGRRDRRLRILDLGTGSGAVLLALLSELPGAEGVGVDRALGAAGAARDNARRLGLAARATFLVGHWADAIAGTFDLVVSNPPYIPSREIASLPLAVRRYDPQIALDGGADGLDHYREIVPALGRILVPGGRAFVEVGAGQVADVARLASDAGLAPTWHRDLAGIDRVVEMLSPGQAA